MLENAVIYLRSATNESGTDSQMTNHEKLCRDYCQQMGLNVLQVFADLGESGFTSDRIEFQRMLAFCKTAENEVRYVVVQDLSRVARDARLLAETISTLGLSGIRLRSTFESSVELTVTTFAAIDQYFSDSLSEKRRVEKRDAVKAGRVPWKAPLGYINIRSKNGSNITPDPERARYILDGFRLIAIEGLRKTAALKVLNEKGLRTLKGAPVSARTFDRILVNPLYAGWVTLHSDPDTNPVHGLHESIVPQELFDRVQTILADKEPPPPASPGNSRPKCG